ncbi:uncharacterized protein LOC134528393 [Bacillus rossius redtenbacheri]|uniref:uncharacterized protein LOC134528393 n=1 Tax=Bacillus rossius redtenbacheri TaxID=93214 RepID=UPI002FDE5FC3
MPDVSRSDSQRSDASQRPRVSFNRDVHVKRIGKPGTPRLVGALAGDGEGRLVPLPVRRERPTRLSRRELAREAERVLRQADSVRCTSSPLPAKYSTLPPLRGRRRPRLPAAGSPASSPEPGLKKTSSTSLSDLLQTSSSSPERSCDARTRGSKLARSASDCRGTPAPARRSRHRVRSPADKSPSPPPRRHRKSRSDPGSPSQVAQTESGGGSKSQLSPIIEASPHDDYFEQRGLSRDADMRSGSRGGTVDAMVRRLSRDSNPGPRRVGGAPAGLVAPGEERQHNNNMPFSYTRPTPARGREGGQVIYAEVVVGGAGGPDKRTVHTRVPAGKQVPLAGSDEDEGLGLSMDGFRRGSGDYLDRDYPPKTNGYRSQVRELINNEREDGGLRSSSKVVSDMRVDYGGQGLGGSVFKKEYTVHESSSYDSGNYIPDPPGRGRADGMDSWKKDALLESNRYENELNRMRETDRKPPTVNNFSDSYSRSENYEKEYNLSSKFVNNDDDLDLSYRSERLKKDPLIEPHIINRSDLSSRRNRLESRIESHRKDRLLNSKLQHNEKKDILLESKANETNIKYLSDYKNSTDTAFSNRRDFLNSQLDFDSGRIVNDKKYESENIVRTNYYNESLTEADSPGKKDLFADSGIEMDYRKDSSGTLVNKYGDTPRAKTAVGKWQSSNVTRVDLNGPSDDEEADDSLHRRPGAAKLRSSYSKEVTGDSFVSARLVKEHKRTAEAMPSSTVLIRHFAPGRGSPDDPQERRRKQEDEGPGRDWRAEKHAKRADEHDSKEVAAKTKEEPPRKEEKKKKDPAEVKPADKKSESKKVKKKQVTAMDKMRQLFSRGDTKTLKKSKKKEEKQREDQGRGDPEEDPLTTRYSEYKGSGAEDRTTSRASRRLSSDAEEQQELGRSRDRLATPSPAPQHAATLGRRDKSGGKDSSWFKSLDRTKAKSSRTKAESAAEEAQPGGKSLRFFGDSDADSASAGGRRPRSGDRLQVPSERGPRGRQQRSAGDVGTSSAESTTEGDSSQQSQKSVVYLHAATVGDIPTSSTVARRQHRAQSREELSSHRLQPHSRTVSRSISVLAPWRPRHPDDVEVHYESETPRGSGKPPKVPAPRTATMTKKKVSKAASVESLSRHGQAPAKRRDLSTSVESLSRRPQHGRPAEPANSRSYRGGAARKIGDGKKSGQLARSASMPKDTRSSGWFKLRSKKQAA